MNHIVKNITPAIAVMIAGLAGTYMVYDKYFSADSSVSQIEPASGGEMISVYDETFQAIEKNIEENADKMGQIAKDLQDIIPASGEALTQKANHAVVEHAQDAVMDHAVDAVTDGDVKDAVMDHAVEAVTEGDVKDAVMDHAVEAVTEGDVKDAVMDHAVEAVTEGDVKDAVMDHTVDTIADEHMGHIAQ